jgi:cleavage and polyadenylation specificity factor subunit 3
MMRLKSKLLSLNAGKTAKVKVFSPRNCEELRIPFKADKTAKVVGKLAAIQPPTEVTVPGSLDTQLITGVLVQNDFKLSLMAPEDLREYAGLTTTTITCKQRLHMSAAGIDLIKWALEGTFGSVEELPEMRKSHVLTDGIANGNGNGALVEAADEEVVQLVAAYLVMGCVTVRYRSNGEAELEWEGNMLNDGIADAAMAVLLSVESSPAAVKRKFNLEILWLPAQTCY